MFNFEEQLAVGECGERQFIQAYPRKLIKTNCRECDFIVDSSRETLELKTDTYNITKTKNFFFERYSNYKARTWGGPWRAARDKIDIFCYYFLANNLWFEFRNLPALVSRLNKLIKNQAPIKVDNGTYITVGYKIPRAEVKDLFQIYEVN